MRLAAEALASLHELCAELGLPRLVCRPLDGSDMPQPYRDLLVHQRDMTQTLRDFHGDDIVLRIMSIEADARWLRRVVVLVRQSDRQPVELGAIRIQLSAFDDEPRARIQECFTPLGAILREFGIPYISQPDCFVRVQPWPEARQLLGLTSDVALFGRRNTLRHRERGDLLADVLEILPPLPSRAAGREDQNDHDAVQACQRKL